MIPDSIASGDVLYQSTQGYADDSIIPRAILQPSLPYDGTINPSLLMFGGHELPSQNNSSSISPYAFGDGYDQPSHHTPSASSELWMAFPDSWVSTPVPSPTIPTVSNAVSPLKVQLDCADRSSPRMSPMPRLRASAFAVVAVVPVFRNVNMRDKGPTLFANKSWKR